jgi:hypothetical protein
MYSKYLFDTLVPGRFKACVGHDTNAASILRGRRRKQNVNMGSMLDALEIIAKFGNALSSTSSHSLSTQPPVTDHRSSLPFSSLSSLISNEGLLSDESRTSVIL